MQENGNDILTLFLVSSLLIATILVLAFTFLISYQKKIVSQKLHIQQARVELQQKLLQASIDAQEKERKRIASDLHDDIGSLLSALKLNVRHLKTVREIGENEKEFLNETATMLEDGLTRVRNISYDLLPPTLVRFGLSEVLKEMANRINVSGQIRVNVNYACLEGLRLPESMELSVFRVIQELTSNTLHHSGASEINIHCECSDTLTITYSDNGSGITNEEQLQGLGMINMQSRIQSINGTLSVSNSSASSFSATIRVPLEQTV